MKRIASRCAPPHFDNPGFSRRAALRLCAHGGLVLLLPAWARLAAADTPAAAAATGPEAPVAQLNAALGQAMQMGKAVPFPQRFAMLAPVIEHCFDLSLILHKSVGLAWDGLPAEQKTALQTAFTHFTIASYTANFDHPGRFDLLDGQRAVGTDQVVETQFVPQSGDKTRIDYVLHQGAAGWQVVDVLLDGAISRVAVQRSDFRSALADGDATKLIRNLQAKIAELSGNTMPS